MVCRIDSMTPPPRDGVKTLSCAADMPETTKNAVTTNLNAVHAAAGRKRRLRNQKVVAVWAKIFGPRSNDSASSGVPMV